MKKRIIAALTALVMVVTMIPANAFAATTQYTPERTVQLIKAAAFGEDATSFLDTDYKVPYTENQKAIVAEARVAYDSLTPAEKLKIEQGTSVKVKDLWVAEALMAYQTDAAKAYSDALNLLADESLESDGSKFTTVKKAWDDAYEAWNATTLNVKVDTANRKAIVKTTALAGSFAYTNTPALIDGEYDKVKETEAMKLLGKGKADAGNTDFLAIVKAINAITPEVVEKISNDPNTQVEYNAVITAMNGKTVQMGSPAKATPLENFAHYAKNYKNFVLAKNKLEGLNPKALEDALKSIDGTTAGSKDYVTVKEAKDLGESDAAVVNNKNISEAETLFNAAEKVYKEYAAKPEMKDSASLLALGDALYLLPTDTTGMQKNIELYKEAVKIKNFVLAANAKTGDLTLDEIQEIERIEAEGLFKNTATLDRIDNFVDVDHIATTPTKVAYVELLAKKNDQLGSWTDKEIAEKYAPKINAAMAAVRDIDKVSFSEDASSIIKVLEAFDDLKTVTANKKQSFKNPDFGKASDKPEVRLAAVKKYWKDADKANAVEAINAELAKVLTVDGVKGFNVFMDKCVAVEASYTDGKAAAAAVSTQLAGKVKKYLPAKEYDGDGNAIAKLADETAIKDAIKAYNKAVGELTVDGQYFYKNAQNALIMLGTPKKTDAERIAYLQARLDAFAFTYDKVVVAKVAEVVDTIQREVSIKADFADGKIPAVKAEATKAAFAKIDELFKTNGVEMVFRGLQEDGSLLLLSEVANDPTAVNSGNYKYKNAIVRYLTAKEDFKDVIIATNVAEVINAIDALKVGSDLDAALKAYNDVKAKYDALTAKEKAEVTNYGKLVAFSKEISNAAVKAIETEIDKLGTLSTVLSAGQKEVITNVKALLDTYGNVLTTSGAYVKGEKATLDTFKAPFDATKTGKYIDALELLVKEDTANAIKKNAAVYAEITKVAQEDLGKGGLTGFEATKVMKTLEAYNALTDFEKEVLLDANTADAVNEELKLENTDKISTLTKAELDTLVNLEKAAKALVLDYATIEKIADQEATGEAITPAVVVKDANGNVIDNSKLNITYTNNTLVGTATIVIVPADESLAGRLEANFNIVKGEASAPVVPTAAKLATDQGIIKVTVAKVDGLTYRFMVRKANTNKWITKNSKTNSAVFTGLVKNTMYEVKVATVLGNEVSEFNNLGFVHTNKLANKPARMYKAIINKVTIKKGVAKVTTKNVAYKNEQYRVGFKKYGTKNFKWNAWGTNTVKTVKGLKKGVKYTFTIQYRYKSAVSGTFVYSNYAKYVVKTAK